MILTCGEALIDMVAGTADDGRPLFVPHAGGAVFNTAIALARLGAPVALFSGVSQDLFGEMLAEKLTASGVETRYLHRSARPTTLAFVTFEAGQPRYAFYDEATAGRMLQTADLPPLDPQIKALFFGGISLVQDPAAQSYAALHAREAAAYVTMIDPNIRPGFLGGQERAYRARLDKMIAQSDIVKLSDEDLHWLMGPGDLDEQGAALLARGPKLVLITEGAKGARAYHAQGRLCHAAMPVRLVDTIGAGDTFNAGILAALSREGALSKSALAELSAPLLAKALDLGCRAAAITVSRAGANPPWAQELI